MGGLVEEETPKRKERRGPGGDKILPCALFHYHRRKGHRKKGKLYKPLAVGKAVRKRKGEK